MKALGFLALDVGTRSGRGAPSAALTLAQDRSAWRAEALGLRGAKAAEA